MNSGQKYRTGSGTVLPVPGWSSARSTISRTGGLCPFYTQTYIRLQNLRKPRYLHYINTNTHTNAVTCRHRHRHEHTCTQTRTCKHEACTHAHICAYTGVRIHTGDPHVHGDHLYGDHLYFACVDFLKKTISRIYFQNTQMKMFSVFCENSTQSKYR